MLHPGGADAAPGVKDVAVAAVCARLPFAWRAPREEDVLAAITSGVGEVCTKRDDGEAHTERTYA